MSRVKGIVHPTTIWYSTPTHKKLTHQKLVVNNRLTHGRQTVFIKNRNFCWQNLKQGDEIFCTNLPRLIHCHLKQLMPPGYRSSKIKFSRNKYKILRSTQASPLVSTCSAQRHSYSFLEKKEPLLEMICTFSEILLIQIMAEPGLKT